MNKPNINDLIRANDETGMKLHYNHYCKICGTSCGWCPSCGYAHCFNGHVHEGFDGSYEQYLLDKKD